MQAPVLPILEVGDNTRQIRQAARMLNDGKVVVLPTETVYGATALLTRPEALQRLRALRGGNDAKPFILHLASGEQADAYLGPVSELGRRMIRKLWPGPVALVFEVPAERRREVSEKLGVEEPAIYDGDFITLRCPDHRVAVKVIDAAEGPVVAVQAGSNSPQPAKTAAALADELGDRVDLVLDGGPTRYSKPSTVIHVKGDSYDVVRAGVYDARIIQKLLRTTILFVCSGNTCRSPMAESIARHLLAQKLNVSESELEKKGISVMSAGAAAMNGARATPAAVEAVRALGADLTHHRSKPLTVELIHQADMIFTMSHSHADVVRAMVPSAWDKVSLVGGDQDIEDPIGGSAALYNEVAAQLQALIQDRLKERMLP